MTDFNQIWPVMAFFLGVLSTLLVDGIKARRASQEEAQKALAAREQFLTDRREEFELRHLLLVNDSLSELMRAAVTAQNEQTLVGQATPEALQAVEAANGGVVAVRHFILDESLSEDVRAAHDELLRAGRLAGRVKDSRKDDDDSVRDALQTARGGIAERIRTIYNQPACKGEATNFGGGDASGIAEGSKLG
jgi:hypothetical protein